MAKFRHAEFRLEDEPNREQSWRCVDEGHRALQRAAGALEEEEQRFVENRSVESHAGPGSGRVRVCVCVCFETDYAHAAMGSSRAVGVVSLLSGGRVDASYKESDSSIYKEADSSMRKDSNSRNRRAKPNGN